MTGYHFGVLPGITPILLSYPNEPAWAHCLQRAPEGRIGSRLALPWYPLTTDARGQVSDVAHCSPINVPKTRSRRARLLRNRLSKTELFWSLFARRGSSL